MIDACQWYKSSPTGPAEHEEGGSLSLVSTDLGELGARTGSPFRVWATYLPKSANSLLILFNDIGGKWLLVWNQSRKFIDNFAGSKSRDRYQVTRDRNRWKPPTHQIRGPRAVGARQPARPATTTGAASVATLWVVAATQQIFSFFF